jgi:hypothetical protein
MREAGHDHTNIAFAMADMGTSSGNCRNIDEFGGAPFINHAGNKCHRGAEAFKKSNFHPAETAKRVTYHQDGSGRDTYIANNNGGLSITNRSGVLGTDVQTIYANNLRGYRTDNVSPGYHRMSTPLRIADYYIKQ